MVLFAQGLEDDLSAMLKDHKDKGRKIQVEGRQGGLHDGRIGAEDPDDKGGEEADEDPDDRGVAQGHEEHDRAGLLDVFVALCPVVEAHDGGAALGDRQEGRLQHLPGGVDDGHDGDIEVPADMGQDIVAADGDHAVGQLHDEGGRAQAHDLAGPLSAGQDLGDGQQMEAVLNLFAEQEAQDKEGRESLGQDGGNGGPADAHAEDEDQDGIQDDIGDGPDDDGRHAHGGVALGIDKGVHAGRDHGKDIAQQIDPQIGQGMDQSVIGSPEGDEDRPAEYLAGDGQYNGRRDQEKEGGILDLCGLLPVPGPAGDRKQGGAAGPVHIGEGCDQDDDGKAESHGPQGRRPHSGDPGDIDPVHNVIEKIEGLRHKHGQGRRNDI